MFAMAAASMATSLVGGVMSRSMSQAQAAAQSAIGDYNAKMTEQQASWAQAQGQAEAWQKRRQGAQLEGKAQAAMAEGGVSTSSGSPLLLDTNIQRETAYQSSMIEAGAENQAKNLNAQAAGQRWSGQASAAISRAQGDYSLVSGIGSAFGTASKYFG
jgi:hypothetical protein